VYCYIGECVTKCIGLNIPFYRPTIQGANAVKNHGNISKDLPFLGLKFHGKLPPWENVMKLFILVIYCHSMVITKII
jgi:hypothetical protein